MASVNESTVIHGPGDVFASYECEGDKCHVHIVTRCFSLDGKVEWEFPGSESRADRLVVLYTSMAELAAQAMRHILLSRDRCGMTYGDLYAMSEWVASLLRSAVNFKRHSSLYNWDKVENRG